MLYRLRLVGRAGPWVYVGETSDFQRRAANYRLGHPSGATNSWMHAMLLEHLVAGGTVEVDVAVDGSVDAAGERRRLVMARRHDRRLAEAAALSALPPEYVLNRVPAGEATT